MSDPAKIEATLQGWIPDFPNVNAYQSLGIVENAINRANLGIDFMQSAVATDVFGKDLHVKDANRKEAIRRLKHVRKRMKDVWKGKLTQKIKNAECGEIPCANVLDPGTGFFAAIYTPQMTSSDGYVLEDFKTYGLTRAQATIHHSPDFLGPELILDQFLRPDSKHLKKSLTGLQALLYGDAPKIVNYECKVRDCETEKISLTRVDRGAASQGGFPLWLLAVAVGGFALTRKK